MTDGCAVSVVMSRLTCLVCNTGDDCNRGELKIIYRECQHLKKNNLPCHIEIKSVDPGITDVAVTSNIDGKTESYSSVKYYDRSKVFLSQRRTNKWNEDTVRIISLIPSCETASLDAFSEYARMYLAYLPTLLKDRAKKGYRNMRFLRSIYKKKAIDDICNMIAPRDKITIVGFGNWSGPNGTPIKRRCSGPLQEIKLELKKRDNVYLRIINEMRTSITCHNCFHRLKNMKAKTVHPRTKKVSLKAKIHKVLHCTNSQGDLGHCGTTWNRDVNASKNILMLLIFEILRFQRPIEFKKSECLESTPHTFV